MYTEKTTNAKCTVSTGLALALFTTASFFPLHTYAASTMLEEITVTARKREELLQDIPITVNAFTETALEERGIASLNDIADATPGFDFAQGFGRQDFRPAIRGQSTIQGRANAGLFIDGIIVEAGAATVPLAALERVEIVKGPQSALYGRSTLAGAINYVLKKPAEDFAGEASVQHGQRGHIRAEVYVSGPISETAGFALTLARYQRDGEYDNFFPGNPLGSEEINDEIGGEETSSAVAVFEFRPTDQLSITAHAMYERTDDDQYAITLQPAANNNCFRPADGAVQPPPPRGDGAIGGTGMRGPILIPFPPLGPGQVPGAGDVADSAANIYLSRFFAFRPGGLANINDADGFALPNTPYNNSGYYCGRVDVDDVLAINGGRTALETNYFDDSGPESKNIRLGLKLEYDLTDTIALTSITGYNDVDGVSREDQTFGSLNGNSDARLQPNRTTYSRFGFLTQSRSEFDDLSQELRLSYDDNALRLLAGAYYYNSEEETEGFNSGQNNMTASFQGLATGGEFSNRKRDVRSWSLFGAAEYDLTHTLTLGAELRYNNDKLTVTLLNENETYRETYKRVLPKFTARYQPKDDLTFYTNVARGNKPGTFNTSADLFASDRPVEEETAWSYELGAKSLMLDDRLRANLAVYYIDWKDQQSTTLRDAGGLAVSVLENIGKSKILGVEAELSFEVAEFWNIGLGYALTDTEIDEFVQSIGREPDGSFQSAGNGFREAALLVGGYQGNDVIIADTQLPQVSRHQLNLSNTFTGDLTGDLDWFLRADFNYNSKRYAQVFNLAHTGNRELVNLRGGIRSESFDIELWADNVFNNDTSPTLIRYVEPNPGTNNPVARAIGLTLPEKRRIGLTARYRF